MKAVGLYRYLPISHPDSLLDLDMRVPTPDAHDLLVRVEAVSVNPVDAKVRAPKDLAESEARVLGWDAAGVVQAVGPRVTFFSPGDSVYYAGDITRQGSNSQYQLVDERIVALKPRTTDFAQAAAFPLVSITAYEALFERMRISLEGKDSGKTLLIIGGAGGVGSMAIQMALLVDLTVIVTASRPESEAWIRQLGAHHVVDHRRPLRPQIEAMGLTHVDFIADFVDTDGYWDAMVDLVAPQGTLCTIVDHKRPLNHAALKMKSVTHAWEFMFTRPKYRTTDMVEQHRLLTRVAGWIDEGS